MPQLNSTLEMRPHRQPQLETDGQLPPTPSFPPSPEDWNNWRHIIIRLWQTLQSYGAIMNTMSRDYGFIANISSFKTHLKRWKLHKNATKTDVCYLGMVIRDRGLRDDNCIRRPTFWVHGRKFRYHDVQRSMRRWGLSWDSLGVTTPKPSYIRVEDPDTAQSGSISDSTGQSPQFAIPNASSVAQYTTFGILEPAHPLAMPHDLALSENILLQVEYTYGGSFDNSRLGSKDLKSCQYTFTWALQAIQRRDYVSARMRFNESLDYLAKALRQKSHNILPLIYFSTVLSNVDHSGLAKDFLKVFLNNSFFLIRAYFGESHPFAITLRSLFLVQSTGTTCIVALRKSLDLLYTRHWAHTETIEEIEIILSDTLRILGESAEALLHCRKIVRHRKELYPPFHPKILASQNTLANCHIRHQGFRDAEFITASVIACDENGGVRWPRISDFFELLRLRALVMGAKGDRQEAEKVLTQAIWELSSDDLDIENAEAILYSIAHLMCQNERLEEAKWMNAWIPQIQHRTTHQEWETIRQDLNSIAIEYFTIFATGEFGCAETTLLENELDLPMHGREIASLRPYETGATN